MLTLLGEASDDGIERREARSQRGGVEGVAFLRRSAGRLCRGHLRRSRRRVRLLVNGDGGCALDRRHSDGAIRVGAGGGAHAVEPQRASHIAYAVCADLLPPRGFGSMMKMPPGYRGCERNCRSGGRRRSRVFLRTGARGTIRTRIPAG